MTPRPALLTVLPALTLALAGCGSDPDGTGSSSESISVVASTNVYGDVARAVAGDDVEVSSIITSAAQDPHEYEATARDRLAVDDADVVIENGGGYDSFMDDLLGGVDADAVLVASELSGLMPDEEHSQDAGVEGESHDHAEGSNEHVWYDVHAMDAIAEALAGELADADPDNAGTYQAGYEAFLEDLDSLEASAEGLRSSAEGRDVAITEPVPVYLLGEVGLENQTPEEFSEAVEEGADVPPRVLQEMLDLLDGGDIAMLAYNEQTADSTTEQVREAAEAAGVPVVDFTETLPEGTTYIEWQQSNIDAIATALG